MANTSHGDVIFREVAFPNLKVKNRIFRSNVSGKFDNYDGSGTQTRINWETKFARGGVGAIVSSYVPVHRSGRIMPNYATLESDDRIPFWRQLVSEVHKYDCRYIIQLSHSGRQRDQPGVENQFTTAASSTDKKDPFHGILCRAMSAQEIKEVISWFGQAARRAREAGADGAELHAANGYLITQFLSSGINDRKDEYGGSLENRARFALAIVKEIRRVVGDDFHLQFKISAVDHNDAPFFYEKKGNSLEESIQICKWLEQAGVDAFHVSTGSMFPHPLNPVGPSFPYSTAARTYETMLSSGVLTLRNYALFRYRILNGLFGFLWNRLVKQKAQQNAALHRQLGVGSDVTDLEGLNVAEAREIRKSVGVPVICTGGFQNASLIRKVIEEGFCDAVSIARPLIANNDLVNTYFAKGRDLPARPCTHCNKCLVNAIENPLGCYDVSRFDGDYSRMINEVMSVFHPTAFDESREEDPREEVKCHVA
ncbi:2,4-dienoyl-CoA reductase (NADPH2) [Stigmatella aurantiaca]|uniref:2,4-dienoyl-CoA reductase (NADPH2) n=1 Tax=Stigmatella aurantiaca TaxID=41 RepID=A0A1H8CJ61_STIAU|nr:NADH:flavin oxidoreductase [Stigmatella aurantiaca]SEM95075.1 2,4-dienoyl-CoA reductase (NADPH2) [Stigmatella aurantiaca]